MEKWRASGVVKSGVTQKAASGSQSSKAEVGHSDELGVSVIWKGTWEDQSSCAALETRTRSGEQ